MTKTIRILLSALGLTCVIFSMVALKDNLKWAALTASLLILLVALGGRSRS